MPVALQPRMAWNGRLAMALTPADEPPAVKVPKRRGRPPIHLSASLNLVLPEQLFPEFPPEGCMPGEKRLMLAVLKDAIDVFLKHAGSRDPRTRRLFLETEAWLFGDDGDAPFSFVDICECLGLSPSCIRRGLARVRPARA
ncbi:MAG TPA: hypothetical protein VKA21_10645 [Candidatus Binatia bacterium]|nr:hypothetical protein [Candidatus Binatia bacterium]